MSLLAISKTTQMTFLNQEQCILLSYIYTIKNYVFETKPVA